MSIMVNPITSVLFPKGDLLAKGDTIEDLGVGDVGIFNADTNLAIDGTDTGVRSFYIAVGVDTTGDGSVDYIAKSAGESIVTSEVISYEAQCHKECEPYVAEITGVDVICDRDYAIKLSISDPTGFSNYGYQPILKTFVVRSEDCDVCVDCAEGDCKEVMIQLKNRINEDPEGLFNAQLYAATDIARATPLDDEAVKDLPACPVFQITGNCGSIKDFCNIPENYTFPRGTKVDISFPLWDRPIPTVEVTQELSYEEVAAFDAKFNEYHAHGYNGSYYRQTESGVQFGPSYQADLSKKYITVNIGNAFRSNSNPSVLRNGGTTTLYWDCEEPFLSGDFLEVLDTVLSNFPALEAKVRACDCLPSVG